MRIEQIYTGCLAQGAYVVESEGEMAVIDPLRESKPYLSRAEQWGAKIRFVFETHFHADFVSGHVELANKTGAKIVYGPGANPNFAVYIAQDGEVFDLGKIKIKALHTPGHTIESTSYLVIDESDKPVALFSGDTLFIGDVGRPDLAQSNGSTNEELAGQLYDSLRRKIMPLPDEVVVYPAHGAGSACGKNMSKETSDLLGNQKRTNYALRGDMAKNEFIKEVIDGLLPPPAYFAMNVRLNKDGSEGLEEVIESGKKALAPERFEEAANTLGTLVIDTRPASEFAKAHIPNSINIGIKGSFAPWVGALVPFEEHKILFIAEAGTEEEVITRLARIGYDQVIGYLEGGIQSWIDAKREQAHIETIDPKDFATIASHEDMEIVDVRKPDEFSKSHLKGARNLPLDFISEQMDDYPKNRRIYVHCAGGYRSMIAASILKSRGISDVVNINHGFDAVAKELPMAVVAN